MCHEHIRALLVVESLVIGPAVLGLFLFRVLADEINLGKVEDFVVLIGGEFVHESFHRLLRVEARNRARARARQLIRRPLLKQSLKLRKTIQGAL